MGCVDSHGMALSISGQDADLVDVPQDIDSYRNCHDQHPSRPSRLGFNSSNPSTCPSKGPADSEAKQWSHSLFQNVGIAELRISSITTKTNDMAPSPDSEHSKNTISEEGDAGQTGSENAPGKQTISLTAPRKSPSVSRLCFPFVTTSSSRRKKTPPKPPPTRHKYSCFPSLMSPVPAGRPFPKHQRHSYHEHGYSRTALQHVKWFWSIREDTWEGSDTRLLHAEAYEGIVNNETIITPPQVQARPATPQASSPQHATASVSVYPRRGDIAALRDPYCAHIDRCFAGLPIWTISKTLWMHDMHMATGPSRQKDISSDDDGSDSEETTNCSDDSDATLVESESEADAPTAIPSDLLKANFKIKLGEIQNGKVVANQSYSKHSSGLVVKASWSRPINKVTQVQRPLSLEPAKPPWPTNWYRRWELLVDLSQRDIHHHRGSLQEIGGSHPDVSTSLHNTSCQYLIATHHTLDQHSDPTWDARLEIAEN